MLDCRYRRKIRRTVDQNLRRQVRSVLEGLAEPENVAGFTSLALQPRRFGLQSQFGGDRPAVFLDAYRKDVEKERGQPLKWDTESKLWLGRAYVDAMRQLCPVIKAEAPGIPVFFWLGPQSTRLLALTPEASLPEDFLQDRRYYPLRLPDLFKPGLYRGLFVSVDRQGVWGAVFRSAQQIRWPFLGRLPVRRRSGPG